MMHLTDTLEIGGSERMAVNLANNMSRRRFVTHLCTTRRVGPLAGFLNEDVSRLSLNRRYAADIASVRRLAAYNAEHNIRIMHAHGSAVFVATAASLLPPHPAVVWHIHYGRYAAESLTGYQFRYIRNRVSWTIAVSQPLAEWARLTVGLPTEAVTYIPNFSTLTTKRESDLQLPGVQGKRIVCVANFLPEKDHRTLINAMEKVLEEEPAAHLLLVGGGTHSIWGHAVRQQILDLGLNASVSMLGQRSDVGDILRAADIGVLSSKTEGLPLALIEYGEAALPTAVTDVGQCAETIGGGNFGVLVAPGSPSQLAAAIVRLLRSPEERNRLGRSFHDQVKKRFSSAYVMERVHTTYEQVLGEMRESERDG